MKKDVNTPDAISGYRKMVLFVMFDMPTETHEDLEKYRKFRSKLIELGFIMFQYSVYVRFCRSLVIAEKYENKVELSAPLNGSIRIIKITEAQYKGSIDSPSIAPIIATLGAFGFVPLNK